MATSVDIARTNISAFQLSEFFRLASIPGSHINGETFQAYIEERNPFETTLPPVVDFQETELLKLRESIRLPKWNDLTNPSEFFNSPGIFLSSSFWKNIFPVFQPVACAPEQILHLPRMERRADDSEIRNNLPKEHLTNWTVLARFIRMYPQGRDGYFFCYMRDANAAVFAVGVHWISDNREWFVDDWELGGSGHWSAGYHVLCPGNAVL